MNIPALWSWLLAAAAAAIILSLAASAIVALLIKVLPEGRARTLVILFPYTLVFCRRLLTDRAVPWRARIVLGAGLLYAASPITLVPDFIPVIGKLDNVLAVVIAIRLSVALIPVPVLTEAWPGDRGQLRLLAGRRIPKEEATKT
jgi:uncharacterized membrane protein YkvA (DUF1232 family)